MRAQSPRVNSSSVLSMMFRGFISISPAWRLASKTNEYSQSWSSGFGVRLLDKLVSEYYE